MKPYVKDYLKDSNTTEVEVVYKGCRFNIPTSVYRFDKTLRQYMKDVVELPVRNESKFPVEWETKDGIKVMKKWRITLYV